MELNKQCSPLCSCYYKHADDIIVNTFNYNNYGQPMRLHGYVRTEYQKLQKYIKTAQVHCKSIFWLSCFRPTMCIHMSALQLKRFSAGLWSFNDHVYLTDYHTFIFQLWLAELVGLVITVGGTAGTDRIRSVPRTDTRTTMNACWNASMYYLICDRDLYICCWFKV